MKVFYVAMDFPSKSETFLSSDVRSLKLLGNEPYVVSMKPSLSDSKVELQKAQGVENIPSFSPSFMDLIRCTFLLLSVDFRKFITLISAVFKSRKARCYELIRLVILFPSALHAYKVITSNKPDIVHLFWGHYPSLIALLLSRHSEIPFTMFLGAYDLEKALPISASAASSAATVFTHAYINTPMIVNLGISADKIKVVHRGVDTDFLNESSNLNSIGTEREDNIVCAGRMIPEKGFDTVIDIFAESVKKGFRGNLILFGDGPEKDRLNVRADKLGLENRVIFPGFVKQTELYNVLCKSNWFVLLSVKKGERLPNAAKEAMLAGCVTISSNTPGISELITHGEDGFIFGSNDIDRLSNVFVDTDASELASISEKAKNKINNGFVAKLQMHKYCQDWQAILNSSKEKS